MKDFAKSIKIGNAFSKGQVLGESDGKKYVYGGEVNGTYIVHRQPDGKTYSFSSEQEIKDWMRNSKIGNSKVGNSWDSAYKVIYAVKAYAEEAEDIFNGGNPNLDAVKRYLQQTISYAQKAISEVDAYKKERK